MSRTPSSSSLLANADELAGAVERAGAAVVTVGIDGRRRHPASGIVWTDNGLIVTANHVVGSGTRSSESVFPMGEASPRSSPAETLAAISPCSSIAASDVAPLSRSTVEPRVGHIALAIGRPGPSGVMASLGRVSAVGGPLRFRGGASLIVISRPTSPCYPGSQAVPWWTVLSAT